MRVRDPIHGTIPVADSEVGLVDSAFYQRLRHVKQLGFGELAFPGATHTRHAHSLGAMHMASRLFDAVMGGAAGYVPKVITGHDLISAVREVAAGHSLIDPAASAHVLERLREGGARSEHEERPGRLTG